MNLGEFDRVPLHLAASIPLSAGLGLSGSRSNPDEARYIRITDIDENGSLRSDIFASQPLDLVGDCDVEEGDILLAAAGGTAGKSYLHRESEGEFCYAGYLVRFRPNREIVDPRFIYYWTGSSHYWDQVLTSAVTSTIMNVSASRYSKFEVLIPPLETQQRIADYLDRETAEIDGAVADLDKYVELLEKRRKHQIDGAFAPIIENREVAPLGIAYSIFNGDRGEGYPKADEITDQGVPFINAGDIRSGYVSLNSAKFVTKEKYDKMGGAKLRKGDIVFCLRGSLGKHGVVEFGEGSVASSLCVIRSIDQTANNSKFLNYFMDTAFFAEQILFAENGSAQPNLSGESLARFRIPSIPLIRQNFILRELDREVAEVNSLLAESVKLRDLLLKRRSVLITEVVTGRKQV